VLKEWPKANVLLVMFGIRELASVNAREWHRANARLVMFGTRELVSARLKSEFQKDFLIEFFYNIIYVLSEQKECTNMLLLAS
jgi:hypothetical protein